MENKAIWSLTTNGKYSVSLAWNEGVPSLLPAEKEGAIEDAELALEFESAGLVDIIAGNQRGEDVPQPHEGGLAGENLSWTKTLFADPPDLDESLEYSPQPFSEEDKEIIGLCSDKEVSMQADQISKAVIGFFIGRKPGFMFLRRALERAWKTLKPLDVPTN
ncbi:hypothetical protein NE237_008538 [Protea cynaroides]|uniref:Uncharacterized protein n=1 Tax=Protea cynaroides TaxID=273540 RepID=A0A9Q0QZG3_9MAGN|nr:hypothetical protein NE237_008538 [Protea cynaroides]